MTTTTTSRDKANASRTPALGKRTGTMLRVPDATHATLKAMAEASGESMSDILATAVEQFRRQRIIDLTNAAYAAMRADPVAWQEELAERRLWDVTLLDGLEDEY